MDLFNGCRFHARACAQDHRRKDRQKDQQDFRGLANAKPDDHQRQIGQRRDRAVKLDRGIKQAAHQRAHPHGKPERQADDAGQ